MNNPRSNKETDLEQQAPKERWPRLYLSVIAFLILQILLYAWISEAVA
jgi:hypothetical protein